MNLSLKNILRFLLFLLLQVFVFKQIEIGTTVHIMVYPLFILLLPVELNVTLLMLVAFALGLCIDSMSNTYGLHASSALIVAYLRPAIFRVFAPRDGYDVLLETNLYTMGGQWFTKTFGILLLAHHFWFFMLEMFKLNELLYVLQKTGISALVSFSISVMLQYLFLRKPKNNEA
ncbi:hypothetical protein OAU25_00620 [Crocinitomicaceae bacterium]|nr:hypothetical protein [Crocinitomicaceae bacterium]